MDMDDYREELIKKGHVYGFTYKKNTTPRPSREDYKSVLDTLGKSGRVVDYCYEFDSDGVIHIHGIVEFQRRSPLFKRMQVLGYHSHFETIYDLVGWKNYVHKDEEEYERELYPPPSSPERYQQEVDWIRTTYQW